MDELELVRDLAPDVETGRVGAREAARRGLLAAAAAEADALARARRPGRRWARRFALAIGAGAVAVAMVFSLAVWPVPFLPRSGPAAAAAEILHQAADAAAAQPKPASSGYRYTKSVGASMTYTMAASPAKSAAPPSSGGQVSYKYLQPIEREIWIAPDGSGRIRETVGEPTFFSDQDRAAWIAAGSPNAPAINQDFGAGGLYYQASNALPTDPVALRAVLLASALQTKVPVNVEMFVLIGDALRETVADPALRSALFQVAATLDGIEALGPTTDRSGRAGVAVGMTGGKAGFTTQRTLIFDPGSHQLLGEQERVVGANSEGFADGTVIGYTTYLASGMVDRLP